MPSVKDEIDAAYAEGVRDGRAHELNLWNCFRIEMLGFQTSMVAQIADAEQERDVALRRVAELEEKLVLSAERGARAGLRLSEERAKVNNLEAKLNGTPAAGQSW